MATNASMSNQKFNQEKLMRGFGHVSSPCSPKARSDLFLLKVPKDLRVESYVEFSQESENPFLMITQVDIKHEILLQSDV